MSVMGQFRNPVEVRKALISDTVPLTFGEGGGRFRTESPDIHYRELVKGDFMYVYVCLCIYIYTHTHTQTHIHITSIFFFRGCTVHLDIIKVF